MLISDIKTSNWQLSTEGVGVIAQGIDDIRQCISNIIFTPKGAVPFLPNFGTNAYLYIDMPVNIIVAKLTKEIKDGITLFENRVVFKGITWAIKDANIFARVKVELLATKELYDLIYEVSQRFKVLPEETINPSYAIEDGKGRILGNGFGKYLTYISYEIPLTIDNNIITIDSTEITIDQTIY